MKALLNVAILFLLSCSSNSNALETEVQRLDLQYVAWGCECANWAMPETISKYADKGDSLAKHSIFIEPANTTLTLPDSLLSIKHTIRFIGQFYQQKGYPKDYTETEQDVDKAKVFRYTGYEVLSQQVTANISN